MNNLGRPIIPATKKQLDPEGLQVSIDDWIGKPEDRRSVEFSTLREVERSINNLQDKKLKCHVVQHSQGYISTTGFGNTTGEAFWQAIKLFHEITGGKYRIGAQ
jgi:hypothetical protein